MLTEKSRGNILWVDDEIEHLRPHILFLEDKGYVVSKAANGQDAIALSKQYQYDLILLDHSMPGMDGIETLHKLKKHRASQLVIMITKTEDEWLMNEAIVGQVEQFLIKPVNPNQILMACKQALEKNKLSQDKVTSQYLSEFQEIDLLMQNNLVYNDWLKLYDKLVDWQLKFDIYKNTGLGNILDEQVKSCNKEFSNFIESNYKRWIINNDRPVMTNDIIAKYVQPLLKNDEKVCLIVVDCMRYDHFKVIMPILEPLFNIELQHCLSLLPTATPYSRNAIFSGLFPDEMIKKYPHQGIDMKEDKSSLNQYEQQFLKDQLNSLNINNKTMHYHKIWAVEEGKKFENRIKEYAVLDLIALVINFVDILAHKSSQMDLLKEMVPDESGYRIAVKSWLEQSWLFGVLKYFSEKKITVIMTSDHGSVRVKNDVMVSADRTASSGVRYKYGRNLNANSKNAIIIKDPKEYKLPEFGPQPSYLIAKNDAYFVYPNEVHKYHNKFKNSFQHGGISMEEMIIPLAIMRSRD